MIKKQSILKMIRVIGLMYSISYMIVITFTWIFANSKGYTYFSAGEPILAIKYFEWIFAFVSICTCSNSLKKEIDKKITPK